nr:hypothetical protein [Alysiella crassa]UOP08142.1 hypothetical protein LVJ80_00770 [Alysiella crassa]
MSSELDNTDQLKIFFDDARHPLNGIQFLPPDVNESFYRFIPNANKQIRYALGAIKGTGEAAVNAMVAARESGGKFKSLFDFCERVGKHHANRRVLEALIKGGAFDSIEPNRAMLFANIDLALQHADQKAENANQGGLFDMLDDVIDDIQMQPAPAWSDTQKLAEEKTAIGFYLSQHPFEPYRSEVRQIARTTLLNLRPSQNEQRVAGFVTQVRTIMGKNGKFVAITLEDDTAAREVVVRGEVLDNLPKETLKADQVLVCECRVSEDHFNGGNGLRLNANAVYTLNEARAAYARGLTLFITPQVDVAKLAEILRPNCTPEWGRRVGIKLEYENEMARGTLLAGAKWRVGISAQLLAELEMVLGQYGLRVDW